MPKHPLPQSLVSYTHPVYQGATHDVVYRGSDDEKTRDALFEMLTDRRGTQIVQLVNQYRNEDHLDDTNALMKAHLGNVMFEAYRSGKPTTQPSSFTKMFDSLVDMFHTRGDEPDGVKGEKSHISRDSNGRFFYKGTGYDVSLPENWRNTALSKVVQPYLKITPKNDELARRLADDFNKLDNPATSNMVKLATYSIECVTHGCSEIAFVNWDATMNMQGVLTDLKDLYGKETPDVIKSVQATTNGNTFTYGNATFEMTRNGETGLRIKPTDDTANAEEFVDKLLKDWNEKPLVANDKDAKLTKLTLSACNVPNINCIDVGFDRITTSNLKIELFGLKAEVGNYKYANITKVMDEMFETYRSAFKGTHDDLFDKFQHTIEPVPTSVEHHTTYDGGIGPLGNVLAEM